MKIENVQAILGRDQRLQVVAALLDGELHYTADHREIGKNIWAVFSKITQYDEVKHDGVDSCIDMGIYKAHDITHTRVEQDYYTWVKLDMGDLKFTR